MTAAFHLNNREANRELNVYNNGNLLPPCPVSTYLGMNLNRSLTFRHHLETLRIKTLHPLRRLAGSGWGAGDKTLRISAPFLIYPPLRTAHQFVVVVCILTSLTAFSMTLCALSLDASVLHQRRTYFSSQASSQLNSVD